MLQLWKDSRFWAAVVLLLKAVLFYVKPDFPGDIWAAIDAVLAVVIGSLAVAGETAARRALRERGRFGQK